MHACTCLTPVTDLGLPHGAAAGMCFGCGGRVGPDGPPTVVEQFAMAALRIARARDLTPPEWAAIDALLADLQAMRAEQRAAEAAP
jgi:hypothetical protein